MYVCMKDKSSQLNVCIQYNTMYTTMKLYILYMNVYRVLALYTCHVLHYDM